MEIHSTFTVPAPRAQAWSILTDLPRIAPCLSGAHIDAIVADGDAAAYRGWFSIKVGPVRAKYEGIIRVESADEAQGRVVLVGTGEDRSGAGLVSARIAGQLTERVGGCQVDLATDLDVKGRLSQFTGRSSIVQGIADRIIGDFARNLQAEIQSPVAEPAPADRGVPVQSGADAARSPGPGPRRSPPRQDSLDVGALSAALLRDTVDPKVVVIAIGAALLGWLLGSRSRRVGRIPRGTALAVTVAAPRDSGSLTFTWLANQESER